MYEVENPNYHSILFNSLYAEVYPYIDSYVFFHFLQGFDSTAKIDFPSILLGSFTYTYNLAGTVYCSSNSHLDICTDTTTATFNYTVCSTKQVFSSKYIKTKIKYD